MTTETQFYTTRETFQNELYDLLGVRKMHDLAAISSVLLEMGVALCILDGLSETKVRKLMQEFYRTGLKIMPDLKELIVEENDEFEISL